MSARRRPRKRSSAVDYETLADFRYHIRRFLRVREDAVRASRIEPQQYLLLLQVKGLVKRGRPTIGALAERLQIRHHSAVGLVERLVGRGLVVRHRDRRDHREVTVALTPPGEAVVRTLAAAGVEELRTSGPALIAALQRLIKKTKRTR